MGIQENKDSQSETKGKEGCVLLGSKKEKIKKGILYQLHFLSAHAFIIMTFIYLSDRNISRVQAQLGTIQSVFFSKQNLFTGKSR